MKRNSRRDTETRRWMRKTASSVVWAALLFALAALSTGCAFMNRDNTPLLNFVEDKMWPEQTGWRIVAAPVVFPAGLVAVTLDAVVVHPATVVDDAWEDTKDALWDEMKWDRKYMTVCASLPWRGLCTPVVLTCDFLGRAMFDIERRADIERERQSHQWELDHAQDLLTKGKPDEAFSFLKDKVHYWDMDRASRSRYAALLLWSARESDNLRALPFYFEEIAGDVLGSPDAAPLEEQIKRIRKSPNPLDRWYGLELELNIRKDSTKRVNLFREGLREESGAFRFRVLRYLEGAVPPELLPDLERVAASDPDSMNRALAGEMVRRAKE